jgi:hypothetical protein
MINFYVEIIYIIYKMFKKSKFLKLKIKIKNKNTNP